MTGGAETLESLHRRARLSLAQAGIEDAALDARLLVEFATATERIDLIRDPGRQVPLEAVGQVEAVIARRLAGEPVHRILGKRDFYGLTLALSPDTLEPRPDTEALVDAVLPRLREIAAGRGTLRFLDLGTGTGAIALAVLGAIPQARVLASDISPGALETARRNAQAMGVADRFETVESDWFAGISGRHDAILSNPPYISVSEYANLPREVRDFDPHRALVAGADGLDAYRSIAAGAAAHLEAHGIVGVEIGSTQKDDVITIFEASGFVLVKSAQDLAGRDRALVFGR